MQSAAWLDVGMSACVPEVSVSAWWSALDAPMPTYANAEGGQSISLCADIGYRVCGDMEEEE
jgi:hypothetical protein